METEKIMGISNKNFSGLNEEQLFWRKDKEHWSVANCLIHLNLFANYYHPVIEKKIRLAEESGNLPDPVYISGWLGDYFVRMMKPDLVDGVVNKYKTNPKFDPDQTELHEHCLFTFLENQSKLLELLDKAKQVDLSNIKVPIANSNIVSLKLGDTFRFLIAHNQRHIIQAQTIVSDADFPE